MTECCLCLNPVFDQPAGCLTKILVCDNRTDDEPHALCWNCTLNLKKENSPNGWFLSCPICRNKCEFSEDTVANTGKMNIEVCDECKCDMDEFGPRMKSSVKNVCISCRVKERHILNEHETYIENYEALGTAPVCSSRTLTQNDVYEGDIEDGLRLGWGICVRKNGDLYEGEWKNDLRCGKGTLTFKNGDRYEGEWKSGKIHGKGKYEWKNGDIYAGEWKSEKHHGKGKYEWKNGVIYAGEWRNGKRHGEGMASDVEVTCWGGWENNKKSGFGVAFWAEGEKYVGHFKNGKKCGQGTLVYSCGDKYEGEWKDDLKHGQGVLTRNGGFVFRGEWENGAMCEKTMLHVWPDGATYVGEWNGLRMHGRGVKGWGDGVKIDCEWKNGRPHGKGKIIIDGESCSAKWWNGLLCRGFFGAAKLFFKKL